MNRDEHCGYDTLLRAANIIADQDGTESVRTSSSRARTSTSRTSSTKSSLKLQLATKAARVKAELSFLNLESEKKLQRLMHEEEMRALSMKKELACARAELEAVETIEAQENESNFTPLNHLELYNSIEKVEKWESSPQLVTASTLNPHVDNFEITKPSLINISKPVNKVSDKESVKPKSVRLEADESVHANSREMTKVMQPDSSMCATPTHQLGENVNTRPPSHEGLYGDSSSMILAKHLSKPVVEIRKFAGEPLDFHRFTRQFQAKIMANASDSAELLNYLEQFTYGEAHKVVTGFAQLDPDIGFSAAWKELEERYGDKELVAHAYVTKALNWPVIKVDNVKSLDELGLFLTECQNAARDIETMKLLEYPENVKRLVMKLPYSLQERWRNIVVTKRERGMSVTFAELTSFIKREAKKASDPIYGRAAMATDKKESHSKVKHVAPSLGTTHYDDTNACLFCTGTNHQTQECFKLRNRDINERKKWFVEHGLCFSCCKAGHRSNLCRFRLTCKVCNKKHPTVLHIVVKTDSGRIASDREKKTEEAATCNETITTVPEPSTATNYRDSNDMGAGTGTMAALPVRIRSKRKEVLTYAFLDPGSSISFCTTELMNELQVDFKPVSISIGTVGCPKGQILQTNKVAGLEILPLIDGQPIQLPTVFTTDNIPVTEDHMVSEEDIAKWRHLDGISVPLKLGKSVGIMIGSNVPDVYCPLDTRVGPSGSPHAILTRLGWVIWNAVRFKPVESELVNQISIIAENEELREENRRLTESFNYDFPERIINDQKQWSVEDKMFIHKVEKSINFVDGHYVIPLPLRDNVTLPYNKGLAVSRLRSLEKKLRNNEQYFNDYKAFMCDVIDSGHAEIVPDSEVDKHSNVWYLPHHSVRHPKKDKLRIVFDCAAKYAGVSLNDCLLQGPNLTNNLVGTLLRFRQGRIATMSDIKGMFHQVQVPSGDSDYLRFLWWKDGNLDNEPTTYRMVVHLFGSVSSPSCANFALRYAAEHTVDNRNPKAIEAIKRSFYVDDCLKSVDSTEEMVEVMQDTIKICKDGGFHLHKIISNDRDVMKAFPSDEWSSSVNIDLDELPTERALGVSWDLETDQFKFRISINPEQPVTRRGILSCVSSVYDPLGLVSPYILVGKLLLQELCRCKVGWDDDIDERYTKQWMAWLQSIPKLELIRIPRCLKPSIECLVYQLHYFADASDVGYGVVCYLRTIDIGGSISCSFVLSKARVAPLKKITIPRMELTAAVVAVRMNNMILKELELPVNKVVYWTDSQCVLRYISNDSARYHTFVANRVSVIRDGSEVNQWRYVETSSNPADSASRGLDPSKCEVESERWFKGPLFLWKEEFDWPKDEVNRKLPPDESEVKKLRLVNALVERKNPMDSLIDHYSQWWKLKRAVAWLKQCQHKLLYFARERKSIREKQLLVTTDKLKLDKEVEREMKTLKTKSERFRLTPSMIAEAEQTIIKHVQRQSFSDELSALSQKNDLKLKSRLSSLDVYVHDGIIRVGGRLERACVPYDMKHQIVLPNESLVSRLILEDGHQAVGHLGRNSILARVRQKFWILHSPALIRSIVSKCVPCRRYRGNSAGQKMADLPLDRLAADKPPFSKTGMDYFGPVEVKKGRSFLKRYGVVFTCITCRAIHLEVANSLETDSCINAIRRFVARRGAVGYIRSDNGSNLVGAANELQQSLKALQQDKIADFCSSHDIKWEFNPPSGSHFGGIWERMIRSVRKILFHLLRGQNLDDELLNTVMCEVEAILNNRPLYEMENDNPNDPRPLTPNHLLMAQPRSDFPIGVFSRKDIYATRRWRQVQYLADLFWKRWSEEYLHFLQTRSKWYRVKRNVAIGDVVLIMDTCVRNSWVLGKVTEVECDKKALVRAVKVKTKTNTLRRPVDKLCVLVEAQARE